MKLNRIDLSFFRNGRLKKYFLIMRLTSLLILVFTLQMSASVWSQNISIRLKNSTLQELFTQIEKSSNYRFFYNNDEININQRISVDAEENSVGKILTMALEGLPYSFKELDNKLILIEKTNSVTKTSAINSQQQKSITGTVTDIDGVGLPGVTVVIKGTTTGTITDVDGKFSFLSVPANATLQFSFVGLKSQELLVGDKTTIKVVMMEESMDISEVVVTGYTVEKKKDIIGSVSIVNTEEMLSTPSGNVSSQLQGRVAGLTVNADGAPGASNKVRVRGFGSFNGSEPLYIIDGVPGSIDRLNPNDIESVQVLKDAASASVYGARAANGVIIITSKQGKAGKVKISVDSYYGMNYFSKSNFPDLLNAQEWGDLYWKAMAGAGRTVGSASWKHDQYGTGANPVIPEYIYVNNNGTKLGGTALEALRTSNATSFASMVDPNNYNFKTHQIVKSADTDWFDETFNAAPVQNHQVTASGGSEAGTYVLSLNYYDEKSTADEWSYYKRYTLRTNSNFNVTKNIKFGENLQLSYNKDHNGALPSAAWTMHPMIPVYDIMGNPASSGAPALVAVNDTGRNPVTEPWRNRMDYNETYGIFGNVFLDITPIKNLVFHTSFGIDNFSRQSLDMTQITYEHAENTTANSLLETWYKMNTWTWTNTMNYSKTVGASTFKLLLGTEAINYKFNLISGTRANYVNEDDSNLLVLNAGTGAQSNTGLFVRNTLFSLFTRFDYSLKDRYIFNATIRRDGSSKFSKENKYGYFPSAALGWRITGEEFMKGISWLSDMKLRASWGIIGNQTGLSENNQYSTYQIVDTEGYPVAGSNASYTTSLSPYSVGNQNAKWEKTVTTNIGVDATLFDGSVTANIDYFLRKTNDLLVQNQAPYTGWGSTVVQPYVNVGSLENKGIELNLTKRGTVLGDLKYEVSANFTKYKNMATKVLDNPNATLAGGSTRLGNVNLTKAGYPISFYYGYKIDGFFNSAEEVSEYNSKYSTWFVPKVGGWRIKDVSGPNGTPDNVVNDYDKTYLGSPHPDFQMGVNLSLTYKAFDFSTFIFWNQGGELFNYSRYNVDFMTFQYNRSARMLYDSWTPENHNAKLPILDVNDTYSNKYVTDYFVEDATYVRLKTLQLGYTVPASVTKKMKVDKLRIYAQAQNLFTITKFSGLDPAGSFTNGTNTSGVTATDDLSMGVVNNVTPTPKQILFGINLTF
mgnify:FL=1